MADQQASDFQDTSGIDKIRPEGYTGNTDGRKRQDGVVEPGIMPDILDGIGDIIDLDSVADVASVAMSRGSDIVSGIADVAGSLAGGVGDLIGGISDVFGAIFEGLGSIDL